MISAASVFAQVTNHALAGIEEIVGHYGHNRLKVLELCGIKTEAYSWVLQTL